MARIKYPPDFLRRTELFKRMKEKHDALGPASPLTPYLAQQGIDLTNDEAANNAAIQRHHLFEECARKAEEQTEARNNLFKPVFRGLKGSIQYLKNFYTGNEKELGLWGVKVVRQRIVISWNFLQRAQLFETFKARHDALGAGSPLTPYLTQHHINLANNATATTQACTQHDLAKQAARDAENYREERNNSFTPVFANLRSIGQYLKALYVINPKELGDWGYTVDDSRRAGRKAVIQIAPQSTRTVRRVLNGKELTNKGSVEVILHKGRAEGKEGITLLPGESITIMRGWSTTTVMNTHQAQMAIISVEKIS